MSTDEQIKVLLIEDNPSDVGLISELVMAAKGVHISVKHSDRLSSAIKLLEREPFDVVLSDLGLPDSQGIDTFLKVHSLFPAIPVVVLTGLSDEELAIKAVRSGAQDYLVKGQVESNLLVRSIRYSIERQKLLTQLEKSLKEIKTLSGMLPICMSCKRIRDDKGYWQQVEAYISEHSEAEFSHGLCPECAKKLYPKYHKENE